jgi:hypothetical protein
MPAMRILTSKIEENYDLSVMVAGAFSAQGLSNLIFEKEGIKTDVYIRDILSVYRISCYKRRLKDSISETRLKSYFRFYTNWAY